MKQNSEKPRNTTVTAFWENEKFGEGALLSAEIDAKSFDALQSAQIGNKFLLKPVNKNGKTTYFLEILPPYDKKPSASNGARRAASGV